MTENQKGLAGKIMDGLRYPVVDSTALLASINSIYSARVGVYALNRKNYAPIKLNGSYRGRE